MSRRARAAADEAALLTDLYQLTMAAAYFAEGMMAPATFSFFVRTLPPRRGYLVVAGLEDVVDFLESFQFTAGALRYLKRSRRFRDDFLDYLEQLRFTGEVWAQPEGGVAFAPQPLVEITAPIIEAQLVETYVINQLNLQTMIASKAARCVYAAQGRALVDFSLRRTQGADAGIKVARAAYIAGLTGSSNVLAEARYGIPAFGTMAHSFVQSFAAEIDAFRAFARLFPAHSTLLVDTYDTLTGVRHAARIGQEMAARGEQLSAIRLDSGDLLALSRGARRILDEAGLPTVKIFASGGLNEYRIAHLLCDGAPIDAFGVGTDMGVSADAPWLDCAYKLVEYDGRPCLKRSAHKETLGGCKQVWRTTGVDGKMRADIIGRRDESVESLAPQMGAGAAELRPRLIRVMRDGHRSEPLPTLAAARARCRDELEALPDEYKALEQPGQYPVRISDALQHLQAAAIARLDAEG